MVTRTRDPHLQRREFLRRLMVGLGVRADEAEDLTQEALLRFYGRGYPERELPEGAERALLARVGFSCLVDARRRRSPFNLGDGDVVLPGGVSAVDGGGDDLRELIEAAGLSDDEIRVLELRYGGDWTLREIGGLLGLHVNTVRRRLEGALESLRRCARAGERPALTARRTG